MITVSRHGPAERISLPATGVAIQDLTNLPPTKTKAWCARPVHRQVQRPAWRLINSNQHGFYHFRGVEYDSTGNHCRFEKGERGISSRSGVQGCCFGSNSPVVQLASSSISLPSLSPSSRIEEMDTPQEAVGQVSAQQELQREANACLQGKMLAGKGCQQHGGSGVVDLWHLCRPNP